MDSIHVVKSNMRVEITNRITEGMIIRYTAVQLPSVNGVAHCALGAKSDNTIFMVLQCPNVCVQNKFFYALVVKLGGNLLFTDSFKRICSDNMVFSLNNSENQLTLDDLNDSFIDIKSSSNSKIFFEVILTIKSEPLTPIQRLINDIASPELSDFTFQVDDEVFPAHAFILSARSPVFARMLSNKNYKESQQSTMNITDTSANAFKIFLKFIYTAEVPDLTINGAVELLKLAEKYDLVDLKNICEKVLFNKLSQSDAVYDIYQFAHQYNCSQRLIAKAFRFVERKYFIGKKLPENLSNNPNEVQRLVTKMKEFDDTLKEVHDDLDKPTKKIRKN